MEDISPYPFSQLSLSLSFDLSFYLKGEKSVKRGRLPRKERRVSQDSREGDCREERQERETAEEASPLCV
jgi:hypothetical protein